MTWTNHSHIIPQCIGEDIPQCFVEKEMAKSFPHHPYAPHGKLTLEVHSSLSVLYFEKGEEHHYFVICTPQLALPNYKRN